MRAIALCAGLLVAASFACAQNQPSSLPVRSVTLFTSGVSFVERAGEVDGDVAVPFVFRTAQINDILKSMVIIDSNGRVQPATYAARDPIGRTLQSFAIDVTQNVTLPEILAKLRGAKVEVKSGDKTLSGRIVSVEERVIAVQDSKTFTAQVLNLMTDNGLTWVRLDTVNFIKFMDERLDREFKEALGILASGSDDQRRQVTLHFTGNGKRAVRVGYVTEAPLWKMSYRLVLGDHEKAGKPYLQGWALIENTTDEDWNNVGLSLISGRPVSFIQDLYQPLYIPRPVVGPDVVASPYPQTHGANLQEERQQVAENAPAGPAGGAGKPMDSAAMKSGTINRRSGMTAGGGMGGGGFGGGGLAGERGEAFGMARGALGAMTVDSLANSVSAQASGQAAGELFQYHISTPVNLPRQQAAMIPVVAQDIETEKVSLYNADTGPRFPMNAVRIKNITGLHLKGGPMTLFDEGIYAGDAKMEDIPPGDSRLISYAVDLGIEGERQALAISQIDTAMSLKRGVLTITRKETTSTTYNLKSKAEKARKVLIEHPFNADFKLVAPEKADERTQGLYRFAVAVPAGKTASLKVVTERPVFQTIAVLDVDINSIAFISNRKDISEKLRDALQQIVQRRRKVDELMADANGKDAQIKSINDDQDRIRKNMAALDKMSALYKRYVTELDRQETQLQQLRQDSARLKAESSAALTELRAFVDGVTLTDK